MPIYSVIVNLDCHKPLVRNRLFVQQRLSKIRDFGDAEYVLDQAKTEADGHILVKHRELVGELRRVIQEEDKAERLRAIQALRYASRRK